MSAFRTVAFSILTQVRRSPVLHRPVHAIAVKLADTPLGARFIRSVLEPRTPQLRSYSEWVERYDRLHDSDRLAIRAHVAAMRTKPLISVVMPAYATPPKLIRAAIRSVKAQLYPNWELCIADDGSPGDELWAALQAEAAGEPRIKLVRRAVNGHICAATNSALALATGEFVAFMDHDDLIPPHALYEVAALLERRPDADLIYSDEDKVDARGVRFEPYFKTDWDPELLLGQNLVNHLAIYRRSLVEAVGGLREGFEGAQDYDLALRVSERTTPARIHHIPAILYHWRQQASAATFSESQLARCADAAQRAVAEHLQRTGETGAVAQNLPELPAWVRVRRQTPSPAPLVSLIVPTRDRADLLAQCADGVLNDTDYAPFELIIVDNGSEEPETHALFKRLRKDPRVRILDAAGPFNFSALNNRAALEAKGEILVLLNNDIGVREPHWLAEMVSHAVRPQVGAVGAKLLYPDGRVQHGGVILGVGPHPPVAGHAGHGAAQTDPGHFGNLALARSASAVTAACLALRRDVFFEVGGLDEHLLKVAFNDVDLCLKIRERGYQIVWTPFAELDHHESASRGSDEDPAKMARFQGEIRVMRERWAPVLDRDPFYGPNLDVRHGDYRPAAPPRRMRPWERQRRLALTSTQKTA